MPTPRGLCQGWGWQQATRHHRQAWARSGQPCALCGKPIHYQAHHLNRLALTVDHIIPLLHGGPPLDPRNWQPAHRGCNSTKGNLTRYHPEQLASHTSWRW